MSRFGDFERIVQDRTNMKERIRWRIVLEPSDLESQAPIWLLYILFTALLFLGMGKSHGIVDEMHIDCNPRPSVRSMDWHYGT